MASKTKYFHIIYLVFGFSWLLLLAASFLYIGSPISGDLGRIGGYPEKYYGPNNPLLENSLEAVKYTTAGSDVSQISAKTDVVVLGDSFSRITPESNWVNRFAYSTGLKIIQFDEKKWKRIIKSEEFTNHPPKLLILQLVERAIPVRFSEFGSSNFLKNEVSADYRRYAPIRIKSISSKTHKTKLDHDFNSFNHRIETTVDVIYKSILRVLPWPHSQIKAKRLKDNYEMPFTSRQKNKLLFFEDDFLWLNENSKSLNIWIDGYKLFKDEVESNGTTQVELLIFPDRYSVYKDFVINEKTALEFGVLENLSERLEIFDMLSIFKNLTNSGTKDLYQPHDSHVSSLGYEISALAFIDWLIEKRTLTKEEDK